MLLLLEAYFPKPVFRASGGKLIASYTVGNDGKIKAEMSRLREIEIKQEEEEAELIAAIMAWWNSR